MSSSKAPNGNISLEAEMREEADDSVEAMANALLDDTSQLSPNRSPLFVDKSMQRERPKTLKPDIQNKPLPPLPERHPTEGRVGDRKQAKGPTTPKKKTMNTTIKHRGTAQFSKPPEVANPSSKGKSTKPTTNRTASESDSAPSQGREMMPINRDMPRDVSSIAGAEELSRKIEGLMAAAEEQSSKTQSKQRKAANKKTDDKRPRLQRSREVLAKVKGAITDRLTSSAKKQNNKLRQTRLLSPSRKSTEVPEQISDHQDGHSSTSQEPDVEDMNIGQRLDAEGRNLGSTKIRSLTGVSIPRKPLPSQESGQPHSEDHSLTGDPFSDDHQLRETTFATTISREDLISGQNKAKATRLGYMTAAHRPQDTGTYSREVAAVVSATSDEINFSPVLSGLAQHPDPCDFSSSPVAQSTPRIWIENYEDEPEAEDPSDSDDELYGGTKGKKTSGSLKRQTNEKVAGNTLLAPPPPKKAKKATTVRSQGSKPPSKETGKQGPRVLAAKDKNQMTKGQPERVTGGNKYAILSAEKADTTKTSLDEPVTKPRERTSKRSAIPKPVRKSSAHERSAVSDTSEMDVDELQLDLSEYRIGHSRG